jgi:cell fate (sporulation/competence/biofilm development) regulator YmcA (YheA/YmcA/DUF963 family)
MTAKNKEPSKGGRPSSYKAEYVEQAKKLSRLGATDKEIADFFDVAESTLHKWKLDHVEFSESLKEGKLLSDAEVSSKLYHRALGYSHEDVDIRVVAGEIVKTPLIKHYPPDTTACIFWLKNRQPDKWRDKTEVVSDNNTVADALKAIADKLPN